MVIRIEDPEVRRPAPDLDGDRERLLRELLGEADGQGGPSGSSE